MTPRQPVPDFDAYPSYRGGHTTTYGGYVHEFAPMHPLANRWGWVAQHRLVGEDIVGRPLIQHPDPTVRECVHHINGVRTDNRPENLVVMTFSEHRRHHRIELNKKLEARMTPAMVASVLKETGGIAAAAAQLGVNHQTLRNRFPDVIEPYKRSTPVDLQNTQYLAQLVDVARYFANTTMSYAGLARLTHVCSKTWAQICSDNSIVWRKGPTGGHGRRLTYRGKPTRYAVELGANSTEPGSHTQPSTVPHA